MIGQVSGASGKADCETANLHGACWRLIYDPILDAVDNMAIDTAILMQASREDERPVARFYEWDPPALSFGRHQRISEGAVSAARERGWDLIRRPTGGRGVLHQHEVTYSVVLPPRLAARLNTRAIYQFVSHFLEDGLARLGVIAGAAPGPEARRSTVSPNCFALVGLPDLSTLEGKCVGSAQVRSGGAVLQHGSVLLEADHESWQAAWGEAGRLAPLNLLAGRPLRPAEVRAELANGLRARARSVDSSLLSREEKATMIDLAGLMRRRPLDWTREVFGCSAAGWGAGGERRNS